MAVQHHEDRRFAGLSEDRLFGCGRDELVGEPPECVLDPACT
jgi:hypothetical protein